MHRHCTNNIIILYRPGLAVGRGGCAAGFALCSPLRWAGNARPLALPLGELARLKAVTERVYAVANMKKVS